MDDKLYRTVNCKVIISFYLKLLRFKISAIRKKPAQSSIDWNFTIYNNSITTNHNVPYVIKSQIITIEEG